MCIYFFWEVISLSDGALVYPNLSPGPWDIDIDAENEFGLQFPPSNFEDSLLLDITINAEEGNLDSWDIYM